MTINGLLGLASGIVFPLLVIGFVLTVGVAIIEWKKGTL
jgi:hypothetical protein